MGAARYKVLAACFVLKQEVRRGVSCLSHRHSARVWPAVGSLFQCAPSVNLVVFRRPAFVPSVMAIFDQAGCRRRGA